VPRAGLTTDTVVAEAARVADEVGHERLTLAAVAQRFGVALPSLYKHVDGLDGLQRSLAVLATREFGVALGKAAVGRARGEALEAMASAYRDWARRHPGRYAATVRAPDADDEDHLAAAAEVLEVVDAVLRGYGVTGEDAIDAARTVRSALHGFVALELAGGFGLPRDVDRSFERLVQALGDALEAWGR
jgi:AcrR family transcriptional regulator